MEKAEEVKDGLYTDRTETLNIGINYSQKVTHMTHRFLFTSVAQKNVQDVSGTFTSVSSNALDLFHIFL